MLYVFEASPYFGNTIYSCSFGSTSNFGFIGISNQSAGVEVPNLFSVVEFNNMLLLISPGSGPLPPLSPQI